MHFGLGNKIIREDMENIYNRGYDWSKFEGKTVLISGAYGMLASYIVYMLMYLNISKGISVKVIAQGRSEDKAKEKFGDFWNHNNFSFVNLNILEQIQNMPHIDYIIHAASLASPQYYTTKPVEVIEPNVMGTYNLLNLAKEQQSDGFLFFSTGDIYGKVDNSNEIHEDTVGCMDPLDAHSCYGESKRLGETLCSAFYREYGIRTVIARIGHTYAPTMDIENDPRVFASFMKCVLEGRDITLYSDGRARRPFCYIADATAAFILLLLKGVSGEAYNVTNTNQFISISELAEIIAMLPEKKLSVRFMTRDLSDTYLNNQSNQGNRPLEIKLRALGWSAEYDVTEGFSRVYACLHNVKNDRRRSMGNEDV